MADPYFTPYINEQTQLISEGTHIGHFRNDVMSAFERVATAVGGQVPITVVDEATYPVGATERLLHVTYTGTGACAISLPASTLYEGRLLTVKDAGGGATTYNITVTPNGAETIDGAAEYKIEQSYGAVDFYCDGNNWFVI